MANVALATGRLPPPAVGATRTAADFAAQITQTLASDPQGAWMFILDHRTPHTSDAVVRLVAAACGRTDDLGGTGESGILQAMATRAALLQDETHRIRVVYTPNHTAWRNQVELWFSILVRRRLQRGSFTAVAELRQRILALIAYFNETLATPFQWTDTGRPLVA